MPNLLQQQNIESFAQKNSKAIHEDDEDGAMDG